MERKFLTELGLEKDVIDKVLDQHNAEIGTVQTKLTTSEAAVSTLRDDLLAANNKIAGLEKVDVEALQRQLNEERNGRTQDKKDFTLKSLLAQSGCKDIDYLLWKLGDTVEFDEKGEIKDVENFIKTAKESYAAQFAEEPAGGTGSKGNFGRKPEDAAVTAEQFTKMNYQEKYKFKTEQPEAYNQLKADTGGKE